VELLRRGARPRRPLHWAQAGSIYALPIPHGTLAIYPSGDGYRAVRLEGKEVVEELAGPLPIAYAQDVVARLEEDW
jgi:hypothetical protein